MERKQIDILLVDDDEDDYIMTRDLLSEITLWDHKLDWVSTYDEGLKFIDKKAHHVYLFDYRLGKHTGLELLEQASCSGCEAPVILLTGQEDQDIDMQAMKSGASDYLVKGAIDASMLERSIRYALERKHTEKALHKEKKTAQQYLDIAGVMFIVINQNQEVTLINKKGCEILGYEEENILGKNWLDHFVPEDIREHVKDCNQEMLQGNIKPYEQNENYILTQSEEKRYIAWKNSLLKDEDGQIIGTLSSGEDITERKSAEDQALAALAELHQIFHTAADGMRVVDKDFNVLRVNKAMEILSGFTEEEMVSKKCYETFSGPNCHTESCSLVRILHGEGEIDGDTEKINKNGDYLPCILTARPFTDSNGELIGFVGNYKNITDRKKAEEELKESQQKLIHQHEELNQSFRKVEVAKKEWEETMDCVGDVVMLVDDKGRIKRSNNALMKFTNKTSEELLDKDWKELLPQQEIRVGTILGHGMEFLHKPTGRWFVLRSYPFRNMINYASGTVITLHDSTETKEMTEELAKNKTELEEAYAELKSTQTSILQQEKMASIGQLAASVAHEINNPIGFISSNLETLEKYTQKLNQFIDFQSEVLNGLETAPLEELQKNRKELKLDYILEDSRDLIHESLESAEHARKIVQNLKSFSRIDQVEYKHADINECLDSTLNIVWNELKCKATLKKDYGEIPATKCYAQQLAQVFMNLLVNAAHSIEKQGEIAIQTMQKNGSIMVSISDTGCGIPQDKINRIFEPFFTTKEAAKGKGLGLSITYDIIKKHKGDITVESEVGKGTTFTVEIPLVEK